MGTTPTTGQRIRILVVDDNKDAADSLAQWLQLSGHQECGFDAHVAKPAPPEYIERMLHAATQ